jgi:predicted acetyltransferase
LIEETLKSLHRDRLFPIAALETQNQDFYRRVGFEGCSEISAWEASLEDFAIRPSIGLPRIISRSEMMAKIDSFQRAYDRSISNRQGVFLRDLRRWEAIFSFRSNFVTAICENGSEIMGYLILTPPDETGSIEILEAVAENQMVMGFLFQMIENYPGALSARGRINRTGLKDFRIDRMVSAQWDEIPGFMCALADPLEALSVIARGTQASGAISDLKQGLVVRLREGSNDICIKIKHCCHGAHVAQIDGDGGDGDWFETDRHGLIQLVMGCKSPQELAQAGKLKASDSHSLEAASRLFPKIDPFLAPLDSF